MLSDEMVRLPCRTVLPPSGRRASMLALVTGITFIWLATTSTADASEAYVKIDENAMAPIVVRGSTVEFDPNSYSHARPAVGDLVVFHLPESQACAKSPPPGAVCDASETGQAEKAEKQKEEKEAEERESEAALAQIKKSSEGVDVARVAAGPGDHISISEGRVIRNGRPETYVPAAKCPYDCNLPTTVTVPPGDYFLTVNDRSYSDSRVWGPVRLSLIVGKVVEIRPPGAPAAKPVRGGDLVVAIVGGVLLVVVVSRTRVKWPPHTPEDWLGPLDAGVSAISFFIAGFAFEVLYRVAVVHGEIDPAAKSAVLIAGGIIAAFALLIHHEPFVVKGGKGFALKRYFACAGASAFVGLLVGYAATGPEPVTVKDSIAAVIAALIAAFSALNAGREAS